MYAWARFTSTSGERWNEERTSVSHHVATLATRKSFGISSSSSIELFPNVDEVLVALVSRSKFLSSPPIRATFRRFSRSTALSYVYMYTAIHIVGILPANTAAPLALPGSNAPMSFSCHAVSSPCTLAALLPVPLCPLVSLLLFSPLLVS